MEIERYIDRASPIHSWDPRCKLIMLFLFIFICASIRKPVSLFLILISGLALSSAAGLPFKHILNSLKAPFILLLLMLPIFLFTSGGEVIWRFGILAVSRMGLNSFLIIAVRLISIVIIITTLFSTSRLNVIIKAMEYFRIPAVITGIFLFTYRYIFTVMEDLRKLLAAANIRGYKFSKGIVHLGTTVSILVNMLIRSFEQSERTYQALCLRGYTGKTKTLVLFKIEKSDILITSIIIFLSIIILTAEYLWIKYV